MNCSLLMHIDCITYLKNYDKQFQWILKIGHMARFQLYCDENISLPNAGELLWRGNTSGTSGLGLRNGFLNKNIVFLDNLFSLIMSLLLTRR